MLKAFTTHINTRFSFLKNKKLLIAVSGGMDSVILTYLCHKLKMNVALAHCNFNLRGDESDGDEAFVLALAEDLNLEIFTQSFQTEDYAKIYKLSIQMAARELRYNWFQKLAEDLKFDYILTAHHADDNIETFLINLSRGTGLNGLIGIPEVNKNTARPLLKFSRETIETFAKANQLHWREDSSNASTKYLRNQLRHEVIPKLKETNSQWLNNFKNTLDNLNDTADIVNESITSFLKHAITSSTDNEVYYSVSEFLKLKNPKAFLVEIFKPYGFVAFSDINNLLTAQSGKQVFSETHRLIKNREHLILSLLPTEAVSFQKTINPEDQEIEIPQGVLCFSRVDTILKPSKNEIFIDAEALTYPLTVRSWKDGDYFYPIGLQGKKKLSKYFKDEKLSLLDKEKCFVLCSNDQVVWVINYRADNRFKINEKTNKILKIVLKK